MREPWGYVALGILAPVAEEFVFRGGLLRTLLSMMRVRGWESGRYVAPTASSASVAPTRSSASGERAGRAWAPWLAIAFSALLFGVVHMNWAQGFHGFIMGLLLGWLYYRTGSMMPGIIAREFDRQGFRDSLLAMAVTTGLTALALLLVGGALAGL